MTPSYALGLFFIFLVSVIWSAASVVVQYLYQEQHFDSPFLLTFIGTTLFVLLIPSRLIWERRKRCCGENDESIPWRCPTMEQSYQEIPSSAEFDQDGLEEDGWHAGQSQNKCTSTVVREAEQTTQPPLLWSHEKHFKMAARVAPIWFMANWSYNASLEYTSILSSTVLASTGSLFTFVFAVASRDEKFSYLKLLGVLLGITGSILTGLSDLDESNDGSITNSTETNDTLHNATALGDQTGQHGAIWGDILGLVSAVGYGAYTVGIRLLCPHDERCMSMQLFLGYVGLINGMLLLPIALKIILWPNISGDDSDATSEMSTARRLTWVVFGYLVAKGLLDNVLSDYLWARAVVLTNATVATVGLGLTIPLAFFSDVLVMRRGVPVNTWSIFGALAVLSGFVMVNLHNDEAESTAEVDHLPGNEINEAHTDDGNDIEIVQS